MFKKSSTMLSDNLLTVICNSVRVDSNPGPPVRYSSTKEPQHLTFSIKNSEYIYFLHWNS